MNMSPSQPDIPERVPGQRFSAYGALLVIAGLYVAMCCFGLDWGLPSRKIDRFLFGDGDVWSGEEIHRLAGAGEKFSPDLTSRTGADVDIDATRTGPPGGQTARVVLLNGTPEDVAKIYLRYRLYTYQPDEMITMMALAGMRPGQGQFDARLYQYGGLFIYPVGAFIKLCGWVGLIDVRSDVTYYLDRPEEFGKFYIVARAYSAAWGLAGVLIVFALTRRLAVAIRTLDASDGPTQIPERQRRANSEPGAPAAGQLRTRGASDGPPTCTTFDSLAGLLGALLFTLMPVVVCMAHEGKPHLPGAVLMLLTVYLAIRHNENEYASNRHSTTDNRRFFWLMCIACGAATGMVLSSWPICVLIPLVAVVRRKALEQSHRGRGRATPTLLAETFFGGFVAVAVYAATNPYVVINLFSNREVLRSNFGNSLAMYEIARVGEGFVRVAELTIEGAGLFVVVLGMLALFSGMLRCPRLSILWLLAVPAIIFFTQFVLIGAGKPAEYGRFGIFTNAALGIGAALICTTLGARRSRPLGLLLCLFVVLWTGYFGGQYLRGFYNDTTPQASRLALARQIDKEISENPSLQLGLPAQPAPYNCPPVDFFSVQVLHMPQSTTVPHDDRPVLFIRPLDRSISWADKTFKTIQMQRQNPD